MNPLKITFDHNVQDGYMYGGKLFLICNNGDIKYTTMESILANNLDYGTDEYKFLKLCFSRNNWLINTQGKSLLEVQDLKKSFDKLWRRFSKIEYEFSFGDNLKTLSTIKDMPVFDFNIYGMRLFIGNRKGLFEAGISLDNEDTVRLNENIEPVWDSRITGITSKSGSLMLSSNSDGLFHGTLNGINKRLTVKTKPIKPISLRTGWTGYDLINYVAQNDFAYLKNNYKKDDERRYLYSSDDESSIKNRITEVATETLEMKTLFRNININLNDVIFSFNSSKSCFFITNEGRIFNSYWHRNPPNNQEVKLSSKINEIHKFSSKKIKIDKPISSKIIPNGCVVEFFDKVVLLHNSKKILLENCGVTSIRTFPASIRYRYIVSTFTGDKVTLHSIYPL